MIKHGSKFVFLLVFVLALAALALQDDPDMQMPAETPAEDQAPVRDEAPVVDGELAEGEYAFMYHDMEIDMVLRWRAVEEVMFIYMQAPGTGWIGLNFMPGDGTAHGDTVIGYVDGETQEAFMSDQVAPGDAHFPHYDDRQHGGETSFIEVAGSEVEGVTIIEFSRALVTGEASTDADFVDVGLMTMLGYHATADDFETYHSKTYNVININYISGMVMEAMDMDHTGNYK